ncbi:hypothetical protein GCM10011386_16370 [Parapedobacter defluvii]|uniref:Uncharacterized protein n=1 Tax=Parapedobacter defluvii TaxID=2045106 RepID=A0ABQ1LKM3_9SPHI|nr:hypothetical protein [Parapedobacter defluvii]GGC25164.1 hypothetical protein GCM10011386_16370 [Parapedobacter defluvii]
MKRTGVERIEHSLELEEKLDQQLKGWMVQKIGRVLIGTIIFLTALGLFGNGLLSNKKIEKNGTSLQYERFLRYEKEMDVQWTIAGQEEIQIRIPLQYLDRFKVEKVIPEGYETATANGYVSYTFKSGKTTETPVHFYLNPQKTGNVTGEWLVNKQRFQLRHFIYP